MAMFGFIQPRRAIFLIALIVSGVEVAPVLAHDAPAIVSTSAAHSGSRDLRTIMADFDLARTQFRSLVPSHEVLTDPAKRSAIAPKAIPVLKHLDALGKEFATAGSEGPTISTDIGTQFEQLLMLFGDEPTIAQNQAQEADRDPKVSVPAKQNQMFVEWVNQCNESSQTRLLTTAQAMASSSPQDLQLSRTLVTMSQVGASNQALSDRCRSIVQGMQTPLSDQLRAQAAADEKVHSYQDKPLVITGSTVQGKPFSTAEWKGKVVLVDFWATWCPMCMNELPRVKKAYADFHSKGLELVGVSNDYDPKTLTDFVAANPGMPWPQLLDPKAAAAQEWNPTTLGFGIEAIPTMFLIDKQGICKSVTAADNFETEIPKLLAE